MSLSSNRLELNLMSESMSMPFVVKNIISSIEINVSAKGGFHSSDDEISIVGSLDDKAQEE